MGNMNVSMDDGASMKISGGDISITFGKPEEAQESSKADSGVLSKFLDQAFADGKFDKNDLAALQTLLGGETSETDESSEATSSPASNKGSSGGGPVTADNVEALKQALDGGAADGKFDKNDLEAANALLGGGGKADAAEGGKSDGATGPSDKMAKKEDMSDADFMKQVNDIVSQTNGWGPGEKAAMEQSQRLAGASTEDKQAFLDQLKTFMSDGDINQNDDKEGDMLKNLVDGLLKVDEGKGGEGKGDAGSDKGDAGSGKGDAAADPKDLISQFLSHAYEDNKLSDNELAGLKALVQGGAGGGSASDATSTGGSSGGSSVNVKQGGTYESLMTAFIDRDLANKTINSDVGKLAKSYIDNDE
jgi:hypothetical protein